jgi:hypothetical protein
MATPFAAGAAALALAYLAQSDYKYFNRGPEVRAFLGSASRPSTVLGAEGTVRWGRNLTANGVLNWDAVCAQLSGGIAASGECCFAANQESMHWLAFDVQCTGERSFDNSLVLKSYTALHTMSMQPLSVVETSRNVVLCGAGTTDPRVIEGTYVDQAFGTKSGDIEAGSDFPRTAGALLLVHALCCHHKVAQQTFGMQVPSLGIVSGATSAAAYILSSSLLLECESLRLSSAG